MASLIAKIIIAALAAGAVQAHPADVQKPSAISSSVMATPTALSTPPPPPPPPPAANNDELIKTLKDQPTAIKRFKKLLLGADDAILSGDALAEKTVFKFQDKLGGSGEGGKTASANIDTFPILTELGISTTVAFLEPCGMNTPHVHPRATEFLTVTEGALEFGMILENGLIAKGSNEISGKLKTYEGAVFPQGSIHYQFNNNCAPAKFVATLNSEDPGTSQIAQNFFGLNAEVVRVTLGYPKSIDGSNIEEFRGKIPTNLAQAVDTCLKKCKY